VKFLGKGFQESDHEHDETDRRDRKYYHAALTGNHNNENVRNL